MKFHIVTIFPDAFTSFFESSIIWRAKQGWLFEVELYNLCDYSVKPTRRVDDRAYGMHGQVLSPEPLEQVLDTILDKVWDVPVVYMSPRGQLLSQELVEAYVSDFQECVIICGHYEGIDQRVIDEYVTHELSIGEYVLSSGELAAQVLLDSMIRHIPWALWNVQSLEEDSFSQKFWRKKEHWIYTRPEEWKWRKVPDVLLSWDHAKIEAWKYDNLQ